MQFCTFAEFLANPDGRYTSGSGWLAWHTGGKQFGLSLKGPFELGQLEVVAALARKQQASGDGRDQAMLDVRAIDDIAPAILEVALPIIGLCSGRYRPKLHFVGNSRRPATNVLGLLCWSWRRAGFHVHDEFEAATSAMGLEQPTANYVRKLVDEWRGDDLLWRIGRLLEEEPYTCTLESAATSLCMSARSVQRSLHMCGTSFRGLRLEKLRRRYADAVRSAGKLDAIGASLGHNSPQSFSADFRRVMGCSPSEFRRRAES